MIESSLIIVHGEMPHLEIVILIRNLHIQVSFIIAVELFFHRDQECNQSASRLNIKWKIASLITIDNCPFDMTIGIPVIRFSLLHSKNPGKLETT